MAGGAVDVTGHAGGRRPPVSVWRGDTPDWRWSAKERQFAIAAASSATSEARSTTDKTTGAFLMCYGTKTYPNQ